MHPIATTLTTLAALVASPAALAQIGTTYCAANPNSTGGISLISAAGSTDVATNDVTLACGNLPQNAFGYFVTSQTQAFVANPGGSSGNLCIGGNIGRYAGNVLTSGSTGAVSLMIDLTSVPAPGASYAVVPGDTVNFQFWHRDSSPTGVTSNFSEGLEVAFDAAAGPTFSQDVWPMLTQPNINAPSCVSCHGGICGLDMLDAQTAYNSLVGQPSLCCAPEDYVVPNDPSASIFYQKLSQPFPACGQAMPLGGDFAGDANVIRDWILAGAPF